MKSGIRIALATLFSGSIAALAGVTAQAQPIAPITIIDGGYGEYCSIAAHNPDGLSRVLITGSRAPIPPIRLCSLAIRDSGSSADRAASHTNRGVLHFADGDLDAAMADFNEAARLDDTLVYAHINRGRIFNLREQWEEAITDFDRAIELGIEPGSDRITPRGESGETGPEEAVPEMARVHFSRAIAHEQLEHLREAYLDYSRAAELAPEWDEPREELERFTVSRS